MAARETFLKNTHKAINIQSHGKLANKMDEQLQDSKSWSNCIVAV